MVLGAGGERALPPGLLAEVAEAAGAGQRRPAGVDRWETAAKIAVGTHSGGVDTVYLATGTDFPDGLAAGAAAAAEDAALLLTGPHRASSRQQRGVGRAGPDEVVAAGGTAAVADDMLAEAAAAAGGAATDRAGGSQRFATAGALASRAFPDGRTLSMWPPARIGPMR